MLEEPPDVPTRHIRQASVAPLVREERNSVLPQRLMAVHAGAVVAEKGFGHESRRFAVLKGRVLDDVLELHEIVGRSEKRAERVVDLLLSAGADFVVRAFDFQADVGEANRHRVSQIAEVIVR